MAELAVERHITGTDDKLEIQCRLLHKDGSWRWILSRGQLVKGSEDSSVRMVGTHVDVTLQVQLQETLSLERERALVTLRSIGDGVITTLADGRVEYLNPVAETLTGWTNEEARGRALDEIFSIVNEISRQPMENPVARCLAEDRIVGIVPNSLLISRNGAEISVEDSAAPIRDEQGRTSGVVLVFHDASQSRRMQRKIEHMAMHDHLTGLWNRRAFDHRLADLTTQAMAGDGRHILIYIDLDQFKVINDTMGHLAGDQLLRQITLLLERGVRGSDMLARLGGDEFGLLLVGCDLEHGVSVAEKLRQSLVDLHFSWEGKSFQVAASFGLAVIDQDLEEHNALALADLACYSAKEQGRNRVHVYQPDDQDLSQRRSEMQWLGRIKHAIEQDRLVLYAQRILSLHDDRGLPNYWEVLVRLIDERGAVIPPGMFIPAAERYNIMPLVDRVVVNKAIDWLALPGHEDVHLSVNLSGSSLGDADLRRAIEGRLDALPTLGERVCFEVTETAAIGNLHEALAFIAHLKRRKVSFSLDDFGSGLSSFSYLKTLPVDYLKIDGSFVRDLLDDPVDHAMVEAIAKVGRAMGIRTIAEFVETDAVMDRLREMGVDYGQGYCIAKPVPLDQICGAVPACRC
jgi:diguanylate cyclase (GGDEF)-like protein/PAS domain S-box-containing protein